MGLQELWFILIAALFLGFFVLEGFDFGVGMLMAPLGAVGEGDPEKRTARSAEHHRAGLGRQRGVADHRGRARCSRRFPDWYATVFSALYLPLLAILFAMILRIVRDRMARQDRRPAVARAGPTSASRSGRGCPRSCGAWRSRSWCAACRSTPTTSVHLSIGDVLNPYTLLGGLATASLFAFYGAVFIALKTAGAVRDDAFRFARMLAVPAIVLAGGFGVVDATRARQGLDLAGSRRRGRRAADGGRADVGRGAVTAGRSCRTVVVVAAVVVLLFGSLYPNLLPSTLNPEWSVTIYNASSTPYTLKIMTWASLTLLPLVIGYQALDVLGVPPPHHRRRGYPPPIGLSRRS